MDLDRTLDEGIDKVLNNLMQIPLSDTKESRFMAQFARFPQTAKKIRAEYNEQGRHIPPFLIASITEECNLDCMGCYATANRNKMDVRRSQIGNYPKNPVSGEEWERIFREASELGVTFILIAGGEPLLRPEVLEKAALNSSILFPVFTNGTLVHHEIDLFDENRNLIPILSIEGGAYSTDVRRGNGIYQRLMDAMFALNRRSIPFGVSITITQENVQEVCSSDFVGTLRQNGVKAIFYVEYVPIENCAAHTAPKDAERAYLLGRLEILREENQHILFIAFPGEEDHFGGCLASGRGFFHINPYGDAEPCPFSPHSDMNVVNRSLLEVLESPFFKKLRESNNLQKPHAGGCVLFENDSFVSLLLDKS
jgi:MoaA/NifB/PqqE/SkfB family radical SAM enzyme